MGLPGSDVLNRVAWARLLGGPAPDPLDVGSESWRELYECLVRIKATQEGRCGRLRLRPLKMPRIWASYRMGHLLEPRRLKRDTSPWWADLE